MDSGIFSTGTFAPGSSPGAQGTFRSRALVVLATPAIVGLLWAGKVLFVTLFFARIFRAVVYNKSALVLNMLRRLVGDEVFFRGLREFYWEWRFDKAGTDDFRRTFERVAGRSLERFFDRWVSDSRIPALRFTYDVVPPEATGPGAGSSTPQVRLVFEQQGDVFEVPVVVTLRYGSGQTEDVQVNGTDARTEQRAPHKGTLRSADANDDQTSLVLINGR